MDPAVAAITREVIARLAWYHEAGMDLLRIAPPPIPTTSTKMGATPSDEKMPVLRSVDIGPFPLAAPALRDATQQLAFIREELGDCQRCKLCAHRTQIVFGSGDPNAALCFVGEGPGADEDQQGLPFVGKAGQLLTRMMSAMGLTRDAVYIANVIKCRPPQNRAPEPDEIASCRPFLIQQIQAIRPRVICALGAHAAQTLLGTSSSISALRGRFHSLGERGEGLSEIQVMPTFHPAYLLRNPSAKPRAWEDLQKIMAALSKPPSCIG